MHPLVPNAFKHNLSMIEATTARHVNKKTPKSLLLLVTDTVPGMLTNPQLCKKSMTRSPEREREGEKERKRERESVWGREKIKIIIINNNFLATCGW